MQQKLRALVLQVLSNLPHAMQADGKGLQQEAQAKRQALRSAGCNLVRGFHWRQHLSQTA